MTRTCRPLLGRADLLRALALADRLGGAADDEDRAGRWAQQLGFLPEADTPAGAGAGAEVPRTDSPPPLPDSAPEPTPDRPALQTRLFVLTRLEPADASTQDPVADAVAPGVLEAQDCRPRAVAAGLPALRGVPLVGRTRLWPVLQRSLRQAGPGGVDVPRWADRLARGQPVATPPRRQEPRWTGSLRVLWDVSERLHPYQQDFAQIVAEVVRLQGGAGVQWVRFDGDGLDWPAPPGEGTWLLLSDLGMLAGNGALGVRRWLDWFEAARPRAEAASVVAWVPLAPRQVDERLAVHASIHCLHPTAALHGATRRQRIAGHHAGREAEQVRLEGLRDRLWCLASMCLRLEPGLLRRLRLLDPELAREPGLEALIWADTERGGSSRVARALSPTQAVEWRQRFAGLAPALQVAVLRAMQAVHAHRGRALESAEVLLWQAHAQPDASLDRGVASDLGEAATWFKAFERTLRQSVQRGRPDAGAVAYAHDLLTRLGQDEAFQRQQADWLAPVWALSGHDGLPQGLSPQQVAAVAGLRASRAGAGAAVQLVQRQRGLALDGVPLRRGGGLGSVLSGAGVEVAWADRRRWCDLAANARLVGVDDLRVGEVVRLRRAGQRVLVVEAMERPAWANEWGRDRFGLYGDLTAAGLTQRMRYIEPGTFLMGSPKSEPGRNPNEGPQHQVTLTEGFWLADTTCTQGLWKTVMGKNPSHFKGSTDLPVDSVSWNDVQEFLKKLDALLPEGCEAVLPTEAQWEYACRAGTQTAFHVGDELLPEQANFGGKIGKTVVVKNYAPSQWGLYQMHGNVWEWCDGSSRKYAEKAVENPPDGQDKEWRVLRGGAWSLPARNARSAYRRQSQRDFRLSYYGFRFALRSIKPGQAQREK